MSLDGLRVNHGELEAAAQNMETTVRRMNASLDDLEADIAKDVATWSGDQQQAYYSSKAAWDWAMKEMLDLLDKSKQTVYTSNAEYIGADRRGAGRFDFS